MTHVDVTSAPDRRCGKGLLVLSLALNLVLLGGIGAFILMKGGVSYVMLSIGAKKHELNVRPFQREQAETYRALPKSEQDTVFLGDSLTAAAPFADFYSTIKNRGIGGETTTNILNRLDDVLAGKPARIFLMVGTNDVAQEYAQSETLDNFRTIIRRVKEQSPRTKLAIEAILPVNEGVLNKPPPRTAAIGSLNPKLRQLAKDEGVEFIDLTAAVSDEKGVLKKEFTTDGLHLSLPGQLALLDALRPYVTGTAAATRP